MEEKISVDGGVTAKTIRFMFNDSTINASVSRFPSETGQFITTLTFYGEEWTAKTVNLNSKPRILLGSASPTAMKMQPHQMLNWVIAKNNANQRLRWCIE